MGARSCARAIYLFGLCLLLLVGGGLLLATVTELYSTPGGCRSYCGIAAMYAAGTTGCLRLAGAPASVAPCNASISYASDFANGCFSCSANGDSTTWPCTGALGITQFCTSTTNVTALTCIGQAQPTGPLPALAPIVVAGTVDSGELARCGAAMGAPAAAGVCDTCIAAGRCFSSASFVGPGFYASVRASGRSVGTGKADERWAALLLAVSSVGEGGGGSSFPSS